MSKQEHHYYASHALAWATADTREEATEKLMQATDPTWVRNCLKNGTFVTIWSCCVHEPEDTAYQIEWFQPVGVRTSAGKNEIVTYLTKKAHTLIPDPQDEVRKLQHEVKLLKEEAKHMREELNRAGV